MTEAERQEIQVKIWKEIVRNPKKHSINAVLAARGALNELKAK